MFKIHKSLNAFALWIITALVLSSCGSTKLVVMSFNVRQSHVREKDENNNWGNRKEACLEMLHARKPDIIGLQEAQFKDQWAFFRDTLQAEYGSFGVGRENGTDKGETSGFLYKKSALSLLDSGTFWVSETPDVPSKSFDEQYVRSLTWGLFKIRKTGKRFFYFNTHLGLTWKSQVEGIRMIIGKMEEINPDGLPLIFSGDLNTDISSPAFDSLKGIMLNSSEVAPVSDEIPTYNAWGNKQKERIIDFIWLTPGIKCLEYHTDTTPYGGHELISDHYPVYIIVKI
jgi:endonuclease/exonuclease/phosphatase family metal-dependent hydrolase